MTPTDKQELLPCPFCGGSAEVERLGTYRASMIIMCSVCGANVRASIRLSDSIWNDRQLPDQASAGDGWISVEDRLPDDSWASTLPDFSGMHSVANSAGVSMAYYSRKDNMWFTDCPAYKVDWIDKITHWQPLPNPPSDKTGDQE